MKHNNVINVDTPLTINNVFLVEANNVQIPEEKYKEDDHLQGYNIIQIWHPPCLHV